MPEQLNVANHSERIANAIRRILSGSEVLPIPLIDHSKTVLTNRQLEQP